MRMGAYRADWLLGDAAMIVMKKRFATTLALVLASAGLTGCVYYPNGYGGGYYAAPPVAVVPPPVVFGGCWHCGWGDDDD
jgi:hypothetical protein